MSELRGPVINGMEIRDAIGGSINDIDENTHEVQMVFPHDVRDTYDTCFTPDCFRAGWAQKLPLLAFQHDIKDPIGRVVEAQSTRNGNEIRAKFSSLEDVPTARRAYSQIKDGTLDEVSFGFRRPTYAPHPRMRGVRNVVSAHMLEVSPVSYASIPGALVTGVRGEEELMSERSVAEITGLVENKLISVEEGKRMLAEIEGIREHITIISPEQRRIQELEAELQKREAAPKGGKKKPVEPDSGAGGSEDDDYEDDPEDDDETRLAKFQAHLRASREGKKVGAKTQRIRELEEQVRALGGTIEPDGTRHDEWTPPPIPPEITANDLLMALHPSWQEHLVGVRIAIAAPGEEFRDIGNVDESAGQIAEMAEAAHASAADWLKDVDVRALPDEVQQALTLYDAGGKSIEALLDVLDVEGRASGTSTEPADVPGAEDMAPTEVKCLLCGGSGETEDGKTCPQCMGSGIVALTRDDIPDDAPEGAKTCPTCKGTGKLPAPSEGGHQLKCPNCKGKGWVTKADTDDMDKRADASTWSEKPWSDFSQADYTPAQWKEACLIVDGDGSTKAQCSLPVKEPDGTYNVNGIAAAAARIDQVQTDGDSKQDAADALANLYGQMKKPVPPEVAKLTQRDDTPSAEELESQRQKALERLERRSTKKEPVAS